MMHIYLYKNSKFIISPTKLTVKDLNINYGIKIKKIQYIPYGVSDLFFNLNFEEKIEKEFYKIIYVGQLVKRKRVDRIINSIKNLPKKYHLDIYGDGIEYKELKKIASSCRRIKFHGFISEESKLVNAYENADLMVLPSLNEEMPLSILEALASKVPVLSSNINSIRVAYGDKIFYFQNIENLHQRIKNIIQSDNEKIKEDGKKFALNYTWNKHFDKLHKIYLEIYKNNNKFNE
jgi:glycosyltransferase involved in cell wall biosynthesis